MSLSILTALACIDYGEFSPYENKGDENTQVTLTTETTSEHDAPSLMPGYSGCAFTGYALPVSSASGTTTNSSSQWLSYCPLVLVDGRYGSVGDFAIDCSDSLNNGSDLMLQKGNDLLLRNEDISFRDIIECRIPLDYYFEISQSSSDTTDASGTSTSTTTDTGQGTNAIVDTTSSESIKIWSEWSDGYLGGFEENGVGEVFPMDNFYLGVSHSATTSAQSSEITSENYTFENGVAAANTTYENSGNTINGTEGEVSSLIVNDLPPYNSDISDYTLAPALSTEAIDYAAVRALVMGICGVDEIDLTNNGFARCAHRLEP